MGTAKHAVNNSARLRKAARPRNQSDRGERLTKAEYEAARRYILEVLEAAGFQNVTDAGKAWAALYERTVTEEGAWQFVTGNPKTFLDATRNPRFGGSAHQGVPVSVIHRAIWALGELAPEAFAEHPISKTPESQVPQWWPTYKSSRRFWKAFELGFWSLQVEGNVEQCAIVARDYLEGMGAVPPKRRDLVKDALQAFLFEHASNLVFKRLRSLSAKRPSSNGKPSRGTVL
jgi:hypothetical protein